MLQAVRRAGIASRTEITAETGLTAMSVYRLIHELRRHRLVLPAGMTPAGAVGRPSSLFRFNSAIGHVVGIDVGNETTRGEIVELDRTLRARREIPTAEIEEDFAACLLAIVADLQSIAGVTPDLLVGVAVGVPAVADPAGRIIRASQHHSSGRASTSAGISGARWGQTSSSDRTIISRPLRSCAEEHASAPGTPRC